MRSFSGLSNLNPLNVPEGPYGVSSLMERESFNSLVIMAIGAFSGVRLKSPVRITGKLAVFNSLIFRRMSLADYVVA